MTITRRQLLTTAAAPFVTGAAPRRPNIILILADDLGWGDLRCYNRDSKIPTPNLDSFARQGVRFTDMHSPSSVCTPTRYGILTGRYCWRSRLKSGVLQGYSPNLIEDGRATLPSVLRNSGYYTAGVGKWHLGLGERDRTDYDQPLRPGPNQHGFDYYFGIPASLDMAPYLYFENDRVVERATGHTPGSGGKTTTGPFWREGPIAPGFDIGEVMPVLTKKAVSIIRERAGKPSDPFFLYFPMTGPHTPWMPTRGFRGKSRAGDYGDFVAQIDDAAGQVFRAVERAGIAENTLVLFTSDNGGYWPDDFIERYGHRSNNGWRGMKADIYDAGHRVPFLARWPGHIPSGRVLPDLGCLTDVFATSLEAGGVPLGADFAEDSFSHWTVLTGARKTPARDFVIHHSSQGMFAIRQGRWKLNLGRGSGGFTRPVKVDPAPGEPTGELYDIQGDPAESVNLYLKEPGMVSKLTAMLDEAKAAGRTRH